MKLTEAGYTSPEGGVYPNQNWPRILKESGIVPGHLSLDQAGLMSLDEFNQPIGPYASTQEAIQELCGKDLSPDIQELIQKRNIQVDTKLEPKYHDGRGNIRLTISGIGFTYTLEYGYDENRPPEVPQKTWKETYTPTGKEVADLDANTVDADGAFITPTAPSDVTEQKLKQIALISLRQAFGARSATFFNLNNYAHNTSVGAPLTYIEMIRKLEAIIPGEHGKVLKLVGALEELYRKDIEQAGKSTRYLDQSMPDLYQRFLHPGRLHEEDRKMIEEGRNHVRGIIKSPDTKQSIPPRRRGTDPDQAKAIANQLNEIVSDLPSREIRILDNKLEEVKAAMGKIRYNTKDYALLPGERLNQEAQKYIQLMRDFLSATGSDLPDTSLIKTALKRKIEDKITEIETKMTDWSKIKEPSWIATLFGATTKGEKLKSEAQSYLDDLQDKFWYKEVGKFLETEYSRLEQLQRESKK